MADPDASTPPSTAGRIRKGGGGRSGSRRGHVRRSSVVSRDARRRHRRRPGRSRRRPPRRPAGSGHIRATGWWSLRRCMPPRAGAGGDGGPPGVGVALTDARCGPAAAGGDTPAARSTAARARRAGRPPSGPRGPRGGAISRVFSGSRCGRPGSGGGYEPRGGSMPVPRPGRTKVRVGGRGEPWRAGTDPGLARAERRRDLAGGRDVRAVDRRRPRGSAPPGAVGGDAGRRAAGPAPSLPRRSGRTRAEGRCGIIGGPRRWEPRGTGPAEHDPESGRDGRRWGGPRRPSGSAERRARARLVIRCSLPSPPAACGSRSRATVRVVLRRRPGGMSIRGRRGAGPARRRIGGPPTIGGKEGPTAGPQSTPDGKFTRQECETGDGVPMPEARRSRPWARGWPSDERWPGEDAGSGRGRDLE